MEKPLLDDPYDVTRVGCRRFILLDSYGRAIPEGPPLLGRTTVPTSSDVSVHEFIRVVCLDPATLWNIYLICVCVCQSYVRSDISMQIWRIDFVT